MKLGRTLQSLALEIDRQNKAKRDFLPVMNKVEAFAHGNHLELGFNLDNRELFTAPLTSNGHDNLQTITDISKKYYDKMLGGHNPILATNINYWLGQNNDRRMIRVLDGNIRAILSEKYRRLDNYYLVQLVLPLLNDAKVEIESCEVTANRLYIKGFTHKVEGEVKPGDVVKAGILIQNSEIGKGKLAIKPLIYRLVCKNGAVIDELAKEKYHIGKAIEHELVVYGNDTQLSQDRTFWLECRDTIKQSLSQATFDTVLRKMQDSTKVKIKDVNSSIELAADRYSFTEGEKSDVLKHLIEGGDLSSWGFGNAVTRTAQDVESYDRSTELESIGYLIMNRSWN